MEVGCMLKFERICKSHGVNAQAVSGMLADANALPVV